MLYSAQTVDGLVLIKGGEEYKEDLKRIREERGGGEGRVVLNSGEAIVTKSRGSVKEAGYDTLTHVAVPHYKMGGLEETVRGGVEGGGGEVLFTPLLGAGCR